MRAVDYRSTFLLDQWILMLLIKMGGKKFDFSVPNYLVDPSIFFRAEFLAELHLSKCIIPTSVGHDRYYYDEAISKSLRRLSLSNVHVQDETLEKIIRGFPLIEYLLLSGCHGLSSIRVGHKVSIFQAEFLKELHLSRCKLVGTCSSAELLLMKHLKTLSLDKVDIREETLEKIICSCPVIERVLLSECAGLTTIRLNKSHNNNNNNNNLKQLSCCFNLSRTNSIEVDKYVFPRLKSLYLSRVCLSAELFESFSFNFPSLEELELRHCHGFPEIHLTLSSIKRLVIVIHSTRVIEATIHAPGICYFELSGHSPPRLNFYTDTARKWKSHLVMLFNNRSENKVLQWLLQLSKLLNSLRESEISLDVSSYPLSHLKVEDTNDPGFCKPVPLEHVRVKGDYRCSSSMDLLNCLFRICRPRYIYTNWYTINAQCNGLAKAIVFDIIGNIKGEMSRDHLWEERDLEDISMQVWDEDSENWHTVLVRGKSFPRNTSSDRNMIRFPLKWRD